jgi:hypothetical protein
VEVPEDTFEFNRRKNFNTGIIAQNGMGCPVIAARDQKRQETIPWKVVEGITELSRKRDSCSPTSPSSPIRQGMNMCAHL